MSNRRDASSADIDDVDQVIKCTTCGSRIDPTAWHPVMTQFDDDGVFHLYAFCSSECRDEWERR